jgi:hypothetical protein
VSAKIASQQMKRAKYDRTYKAQNHVKESDAEKKRNTRHSTKTAQQVGPVDVSAKIASQQMKRAKINRTYNSNEHVKERLVENQKNKIHSTRAAQQAADVHGVIEAMKKKRANKDQQYHESKYLREHGAELLRGGRVEVDGDCCDNCRWKYFSSNLSYALEFKAIIDSRLCRLRSDAGSLATMCRFGWHSHNHTEAHWLLQ